MKKAIIAICCVFALSLALVGCSAGGAADPKATWVGTWDLSEMEANGSTTSSEELETLRSLGLDVYLDLKQDGTGAMVLFGESMDGTWEAKSAEEATFTMKEGNEPVTMKLADSKITMEQNGSKMVFKKGEPRSASAASASASASASAASASASAASASGSSQASSSSSSAAA